jgi:hypothetical protein
MSKWGKALTYIVYVGQLGLDLIMPVLLCLAGCWYLTSHLGWGLWIYIPGFLLGIGAGAMTFWKFYTKIVMKEHRNPDKNKRRVKHSCSDHI